MKKHISQQELIELLEYKNGVLYVKSRYCDRHAIGKALGTVNKDGYLQTSIYKRKYYVHRLVFLYHYGFLPKSIDHINTEKQDNRIENLREATLAENNCNILWNKRNTSGVKDVSWHSKNKKWIVTVRHNKKSMYFGSYQDLETAKQAAINARNKYHGDFANHGII